MANGAELTLSPLRLIARSSLRSFDHVGRFSILLADMFRGLAEWRIWMPRTLEQATAVGYGSLFIVLLVAGFAGAVTSLQTGYQFTGTLPLYYAGAVISESMILELGPVLTALILAGRIGARYAAELGSMRVTEQIDALRTLATHPVDYLVVPRLLAAHLVMPILTLEAITLGIGAGYAVGVGFYGIDPAYLWYNMIKYCTNEDVVMGLIKAFIYGGIVAIIGCYKGMSCGEGAEGVGHATTEAVVYSSIAILITNFFLTLTINQIRSL